MAAKAKPTLRRAVTPWGSFSWGYSDVGADIFVGLGLVLGAAGGASNIAFLFAGVVYVCIGLAYTELAATYPVAGGGQYFVMRGLGRHLRVHRRLGGAARLHDRHHALRLVVHRLSGAADPGAATPAAPLDPLPARVLGLIVGLCTLNVVGVRESTTFNGIVSALDVISETSILFFGFLFAFNPDLLMHTMHAYWPTTDHLLLGVSFAIISFVGLESISQAAQETQRPASVIPRTSIGLILTILIYALAYSNLALGMTPAHPVPLDAHGHAQQFFQYPRQRRQQRQSRRRAGRQRAVLRRIAGLYVPVLGAILLLISSNSGVFGASRIAYAMSRSRLLPSVFERVDRRFRTPAVSIITFCAIAVIVLIFAALPSLDPAMQALYDHAFRGEAGSSSWATSTPSARRPATRSSSSR